MATIPASAQPVERALLAASRALLTIPLPAEGDEHPLLQAFGRNTAALSAAHRPGITHLSWQPAMPPGAARCPVAPHRMLTR